MVMRQPSATRVLLYGLDADLQKTRQLLLVQAGYEADTAEDWPAFRSHLEHRKSECLLVVLCHTLPKDEREACERMTRDPKIGVYALSAAIAPQDFVRQLAERLTT